MAGTGYDLNVQIQLQAPTNANIGSVVNQIQSQLKSVNTPVNVQVNTKALSQANAQIQQISNSTKDAAKNTTAFGGAIGNLARRFGVFAVATRVVGGLSSSFSRAVKDALEFERELNRIQQITDRTANGLKSLKNTINELSTGLGASSQDLVIVTKTLSQAGFAASEVEKSLKTLAETTLGSSFGSIEQTTEGAIAILRQFGDEAKRVGSESKFLTQALDSINAVSKAFAVEASDIVQAVQRVGGVFAAAGGELNEFIALFTSVRATTRESAETISVGLRTIFSRLQRNDTVEQLENLGVTLRNAEGQFVGPLKAVEQLSLALTQLDPRDFRFSEIVEELGGIRQVGKVIPLITQYSEAQRALAVANGATGSVAKDAQLAQLTLANQLERTKEKFAEFTRTLTESSGFKDFVTGAISVANALIRIFDALTPLIPLLTTLGGIKLAGVAAKGIGGFLGRNSGGIIPKKFATGGYVPGSGNGDTVPAMLTPGEFVIRKSSAQKLGADTLHAMNNNRFADGAEIRAKDRVDPSKEFNRKLSRINSQAVLKSLGDKDPADKELDIVGAFLRPNDVVPRYQAQIGGLQDLKKNDKSFYNEIRKGFGNIPAEEINQAIGKDIKTLSVVVTSGSLSESQSTGFQDGLRDAIGSFASQFAGNFPGLPFNAGKFDSAYTSANLSQVEGNLFEAFITGLSNSPYDDQKINSNDNFDFRSGLGSASSAFGLPGDVPGDAKRTFDKVSLGSLANKGVTALIEGYRAALSQNLIAQNAPGGEDIQAARATAAAGTARRSLRAPDAFANGGSVDNVPALLTPGEFVINKSAAQKIGYSNLHSMNKTGVARFATGGTVGRMRFTNGGVPGSFSGDVSAGYGDLPGVFSDTTASVQALADAATKAADAVSDTADTMSDSQALAQDLAAATKQQADAQAEASDAMKQFADNNDKAADNIEKYSVALIAGATILVQTLESFGVLDEQTSAAATETALFAGIMAGLGAQLIRASTAVVTFTASLGQGGGIKGGIQAITTGINPLTLAVTAAVAAVVVFTSILKFWSSQAKAEAEKLTAAVDKATKDISEKGAGEGRGDSLRRDVEALAKARGREQATAQRTTAGVGAIAGGAAIGAAIGSFVPVIGTAIGAVAGAFLGFVGVIQLTSDNYDSVINQQIDSILAFTDASIAAKDALFTTAQGISELDKAFNIASTNATPERKKELEFNLARDKANLVNQQNSRIDLSQSTRGAEVLNLVADKLGKNASTITEEEIRSQAQAWFPSINPAEIENAVAAIRAMGDQLDYVNQQLSNNTSILYDAAKAELDGTKTFAQVKAAGGPFSIALQNQTTLLKAQTQLQKLKLQQELRDTKNIADPEDRRAAQESLRASIQGLDEGLNRAIQANEGMYEAMAENAIQMRIAREIEEAYIAARERSLAAFDRLNVGIAATANYLLGLDQSINNFIARINGTALDFTNVLGEVDLNNKGSLNNVNKTGNLLGPQGQQLANQINAGATAIDNAKSVLAGRRFTLGENINTEALLAQMGLNKANLGEAVYNKISADLSKATKENGGVIPREKIEEIFAPAVEQGKMAAEALKKLNDQRNEFIKKYQALSDAYVKAATDQIKATQALINVQAENAEILAQAGVRGAVSNAEREGFRVRSAQEGLRGTGLKAGDIQGAVDLINRNNRAISQSRDPLQAAELQRQSAAASDELARLADQSARVSDIQKSIAKEQSKRAAIGKVAEDFVFGGNDTREQINKGLAGIQAALQTGTVQNQSEDQRSATLSMLNQLQDIPFFEQLKKNLVASDIFQMTGNANLANAIANATPEEQRLQQELIAVTDQRAQAAAAIAFLQINKVDEVKMAIIDLRNVMDQWAQRELGRQQFAGGGSVRGPGSGTSDSILAEISNGEYIVNAASARKHRGLLEDINNGKKIPRFYTGGSNVHATTSAAGSARRRSEEELGQPISTKYSQPHAKPEEGYTDTGLRPFPYARVSQQRRENQAAQVGRPGSFQEAMESTAGERGGFGYGSGPKPQTTQAPAPAAAPTQDEQRRQTKAAQDAQIRESRARREEAFRNTPYQQELARRRGAYQDQQQGRRDAYQDQQQQRREFYATPEGRMAMARGQRGGFSGGNGVPPGQFGFGGGQMSPQQTNNMVAAANGGGGMQQMGGMTITHNVTVQGMISIGGLNVPAMSAALSQAVGQLVVTEVQKQLKGMNSGFRTGT